MRKILALVLAITTVFALAVPVMADTGIYHTFTNINGPDFRCNDGNDSNGIKVAPNLSAFGITNSSNGNTTYSFRVAYVENTTIWELNDPLGVVTCPACGRKDWIVISTPAGKAPSGNPSFKHYPNTKQITIKVIYYLEIPKCTATCKYAAGTCDFDCKCEKSCKYDVNFKSHVCTLDCFKDSHDANCRVMNFKPCDPTKKCKCEKKYKKVMFDETFLIPVTGYEFVHEAPEKWLGCVIVAGTNREIKEKITEGTKTYEFYYKGSGKCKCRCLEPVCTIECKPCTFKPTCYHQGILCDNCKSGKDSNHNNCEFGNPTSASNYFCTACTKKVGAWKWDKKTEKYTWEPADKGANTWTPAAWEPGTTKLLKTCECGCPKS